MPPLKNLPGPRPSGAAGISAWNWTALVLLFPGALAAILAADSEADSESDRRLSWVAPMREAHSRFAGEPGTLALFGDSITVSMAFWAPLAQEPRGLKPLLAEDLRQVKEHLRPQCWRKWRGAQFGSEGGMTCRWASENIDRWLERLKPEAAVILFGTNDLTQLEAGEYLSRMRGVVKRCLENGTVPLLTTPPPRHGLADRAAEFAEAIRRLARELNTPLIDYHAEILKRRPDDWDGALEKFQTGSGDEYNVPTLIARDGVHPSNPKDFQDYSAGSLSRNGYALRNAMTLSAYARVIRNVIYPRQRLERIRAARMPQITGPVSFDTAEADGILAALEVFPPDNAFNEIVADWPLHPNSKNLIAAIGAEKPLRYNPDMAFVLVPPAQPKIAVELGEYAGESDPGPYPLPETVPIEGWPARYQRHPGYRGLTLAELQSDKLGEGGDRHAIVVDPVTRRLYEFYALKRSERGWEAAQASVFDLKTNQPRPDGWTSADAAGLPIFPAVVRHDEIQRGVVEHALRVTVSRTRRAYVHPATHFASRFADENLPRMGERLRLRRDFDGSGFSPPVQAILKGLKLYGMFVADNGIDWAISVAPDPRLPDLHAELRRIRGSDFEVVVAPE